MGDRIAIDESVEGKPVVNERGDEVGIVTGVRGETVYVDPDPGITDALAAKLGWETVDGDDYPLEEDAIERITDDEVHLRTGE